MGNPIVGDINKALAPKWTTVTNPDKDRRLAGKARRNKSKAMRRAIKAAENEG